MARSSAERHPADVAEPAHAESAPTQAESAPKADPAPVKAEKAPKVEPAPAKGEAPPKAKPKPDPAAAKVEAVPKAKSKGEPAPAKGEPAPAKGEPAPAKGEPAPKAKAKPDPAAAKNEAAPKAKPKPDPTPNKIDPAPARAPATESTPALAARPAPAGAKEIRRARARRLLVRLALFVVLPTLLSAVYYGFIATPQYQSYSVFTILSADTRPAIALESLLSTVGGSGTGRDALSVRDYVLSRDMLARLDKEHGFIAHYRARDIDWFSRLPSDASFEDAYEYFGDKIDVDFDTQSGSLTLRVRAFSAEKSLEFSKAVLAYSEEMVNKLSERERRDRTAYAEAEVAKAEARLTKARQVILELQKKHAEFNPFETAGAALSLRTQLEGELAKARAELMELKSYMQADAPRVKAAQERVNSISAQVAAESLRMVDPKREGGLNTSLPEFEAAMIEKEFAQKAYESALTALEIARSEASRQHRYLATIASPSKPDESTYPRRLLGVLTVFVVSFLVMGIGTLIAAAVREHARL